MTIDGDGAGKLTFMLPLPEAQKVSAAYHTLLDKSLFVVVMADPSE